MLLAMKEFTKKCYLNCIELNIYGLSLTQFDYYKFD